jgi:hypothetical protein
MLAASKLRAVPPAITIAFLEKHSLDRLRVERPASHRRRAVRDETKELWKCPKCGARLVHRNLSHSCGKYSLESFLGNKGTLARELFERFRAMIAECGPYELAPAKTRVAFMARVRFASVNRASVASIDVHFVLPRRVESERVRKVEQVDKVFVHHLRLTKRSDFDNELQGWLKQAYSEYGQREWLNKRGKDR